MKKLVAHIVSEIDAMNNPYFVALRDGAFTRDDFVETQVQFLFAVKHFHRPMAVLAAKISTEQLRLPILRNVWEEVGEGDPSKSHEATFLTLLDRLGGLTPSDIVQYTRWPEVDMFNATLSGICNTRGAHFSAAMLGIIELMFKDFSTWLRRDIADQGWLPKSNIAHYATHETLDERHSDDLFAVAQEAWGQSAQRRLLVERGLRLGAHTFDSLYRGLFLARQRRWRNLNTPG